MKEFEKLAELVEVTDAELSSFKSLAEKKASRSDFVGLDSAAGQICAIARSMIERERDCYSRTLARIKGERASEFDRDYAKCLQRGIRILQDWVSKYSLNGEHYNALFEIALDNAIKDS